MRSQRVLKRSEESMRNGEGTPPWSALNTRTATRAEVIEANVAFYRRHPSLHVKIQLPPASSVTITIDTIFAKAAAKMEKRPRYRGELGAGLLLAGWRARQSAVDITTRRPKSRAVEWRAGRSAAVANRRTRSSQPGHQVGEA